MGLYIPFSYMTKTNLVIYVVELEMSRSDEPSKLHFVLFQINVLHSKKRFDILDTVSMFWLLYL